MNAITRLAPRITLSAASSSITQGISTIRPNATGQTLGQNYDTILLNMYSDVSVVGATVTFACGMIGPSGTYLLDWTSTCGYITNDASRTLVSSLVTGAGVSKIAVIPVCFNYFYPILTAYTGPGNAYLDVFAI